MRRVIVLAIMVFPLIPFSLAKLEYYSAARTQYPAIIGTRLDTCLLCHVVAVPESNTTRNSYGAAYQAAGVQRVFVWPIIDEIEHLAVFQHKLVALIDAVSKDHAGARHAAQIHVL